MAQERVQMQNILNKIEIYRSKSIMCMEAQVSVNYNTATPMVQFKFASRNDAKSPGNWNNNQNAYWFPSFASLVECITQMGTLMKIEAGDENALIKFQNPKKQKYLQLRKNKDDRGGIWYMFSYMSGSQDAGNQFKVSCSCTPNEFMGIYGYLKNLLSQFPTIAQMTLVRYDTWYNLVGSKKQQSNGNQGGGYQNNQGGGYQTSNYKKPTNQGNQGGGTVDQNMMNDINNEFGGGGDIPPDDDIPF